MGSAWACGEGWFGSARAGVEVPVVSERVVIEDVDAERLAHVAAQLAARVRDDEPDAVARWLSAELDGVERWQLLFMLAAMVPVEQTPAQLLAWFWDQQQRRKARRYIEAMGAA
jgi:hypothetical protein